MKTKDVLAFGFGWVVFILLYVSFEYPLFENSAAIAPDSIVSYACLFMIVMIPVLFILHGIQYYRSRIRGYLNAS